MLNFLYSKKGFKYTSIIIVLVALVILLYPEATHAEKLYEVLAGPEEGTGPSSTIKSVWKAILDLINYAGIGLLIFIAFANILRLNINTYGIKKFLPTLILAIIAANFSYLICRLMIDLANVVMDALISGPTGAGTVIGEGQIGIAKTFKSQAITDTMNAMVNVADGSFNYSEFWKVLVLIVAEFIGSILMLILAFLFFIRNYVIYFLVILSPLAFVATVLPQTKSLFNQWWSNFWKWAFLPVVSLFWLWIGNKFINTFTDYVGLLAILFALVCYYMAIVSPFKIGGGIMTAWKKAGVNTAKFGAKQWGGGAARMSAMGQRLQKQNVSGSWRNTLGKRLEKTGGAVNVGANIDAFKQRIENRNANLQKAEKKTGTFQRVAGREAVIEGQRARHEDELAYMTTEKTGSNMAKIEENIKKAIANPTSRQEKKFKEDLGKEYDGLSEKDKRAAIRKLLASEGVENLLLKYQGLTPDLKDEDKAVYTEGVARNFTRDAKGNRTRSILQETYDPDHTRGFRDLPGGGRTDENTEAARQMSAIINDDTVANTLVNLAGQTGTNFDEAVRRSSLDSSTLSEEALESTRNLFNQVRQSRDNLIAEEMEIAERRIDEELTSSKKAFDIFKTRGSTGFNTYKASIENGSNALEAGNVDVATAHAKKANFTPVGTDEKLIKESLEKFFRDAPHGIDQIEKDIRLRQINADSDWSSYDKGLRAEKMRLAKIGAEASVTSESAMNSISSTLPTNLTVSNLGDPKAIVALETISQRIVEGNQGLTASIDHLNDTQKAKVKSDIGDNIKGALKDGLSKATIQSTGTDTNVRAQAMALKEALRDQQTTKALSGQIAKGMERVLKDVPKPAPTQAPTTATTTTPTPPSTQAAPPNPVNNPNSDIGSPGPTKQ